MQAGVHDDELKGTNRAERCRERSSDTEEPGRGCQERARQKREDLDRAGGVVI
jgi:hypothetical protein